MTDTTPTMSIYERLSLVQEQLKAPKSKKATAGQAKYNYRSCEDILEAAKPILKENGLVLTISDQIIQMESRHAPQAFEVKSYEKVFTEIHGGDRFYVEATATVYDFRGGSISSTASARETQIKRGMDDSQITGSASSYARKYALSGLFGIDDTKDADTDEYRGHDEHPTTRPMQAPPPRPVNGTHAPQAQPAADPRQRMLASLHAWGNTVGLDHDALHHLILFHTNYAYTSLTEVPLPELSEAANRLRDDAKSGLADLQALAHDLGRSTPAPVNA